MGVSSCNSFVCSDDVGSYDGFIFQLTEPFHQGLAVGTEKRFGVIICKAGVWLQYCIMETVNLTQFMVIWRGVTVATMQNALGFIL